jgi:hypothetical protein
MSILLAVFACLDPAACHVYRPAITQSQQRKKKKGNMGELSIATGCLYLGGGSLSLAREREK